MVRIVVEHFSEEALRKLYLGLLHKDDWDEECNECKMPTLLHVDSDGKQSLDACPGKPAEKPQPSKTKRTQKLRNYGKHSKSK